ELLSQLPNARPDPDRFGGLSRLQAPDLITAVWGVTKFSDTNVPWLANLNAAIRPGGYFTRPAADTVSQFAFGLSDDLQDSVITLADVSKAVGCDPNTDPTQCTQFKNQVITLDPTTKLRENNGTIAQFYGPDGIVGTADDLPRTANQFVKLEDGTLFKSGLRLQAGSVGTVQSTGATISLSPTAADPNRNLVVASDDTVQLFKIVKPFDPANPITQKQCRDLLAAQFSTAGQRPGRDGGVNADGDCIALASSEKAGSNGGITNAQGDPLGQLAALAALGDPAFRPSSAVLEPTDLTDLVGRSVSSGRGIPARPANPQGGLFFRTFGFNKLIKDHNDVIGDLDLNFDEDELRWDHGASQDENEFREGYLEGEFWDSQIFFRVGKLLMVWGKTELFRNQDRLNPLDIGIGTLARLEEARIGQWAADLTFSPEAWMNVGPAKDVRLEMVMLLDNFQPTDLGKCGESLTFSLVCGLAFGAEAHGLAGLGVAGLVNPYHNYAGLKRFDYAVRLEGRFDRFTFALTDFWGWDDGFLIDTIQQYARNADSVTGAPVVSTGGSCSVRRNAQGVAVGPDGRHFSGQTAPGLVHPFNLDDNVPSVGNCLLFEDHGEAPGVAQKLRSSDQVALLQGANQTLFHTICTLTFDEDSGRCALDLTNDVFIGSFVSRVLAGDRLAPGTATRGFDTIERPRKSNDITRVAATAD
ncbi:MAG: hypothetical protein ACE5IL_18125, partial [Myxococcota bacterium]